MVVPLFRGPTGSVVRWTVGDPQSETRSSFSQISRDKEERWYKYRIVVPGYFREENHQFTNNSGSREKDDHTSLPLFRAPFRVPFYGVR